MAIFAWTSLQKAVREGCRYAITYQTGGGGEDEAIKAPEYDTHRRGFKCPGKHSGGKGPRLFLALSHPAQRIVHLSAERHQPIGDSCVFL